MRLNFAIVFLLLVGFQCIDARAYCKKRTTKTVGSRKITKLVTICCKGYEKKRGKCVPYCEKICENGKCTAPNQCTCNVGYNKLNEFRCQPECDDCKFGFCAAPGICDCYKGYEKNLTSGLCVPFCKNTCINGYCSSPDFCACNDGYKISRVNTYTCVLNETLSTTEDYISSTELTDLIRSRTPGRNSTLITSTLSDADTPVTTIENIVSTTEPETTIENIVSTTELVTTIENIVSTAEPVTTFENIVSTTEPVTTIENIVSTMEPVTTTENIVSTTERVTTIENIVSTTEFQNFKSSTKSSSFHTKFTTSEGLITSPNKSSRNESCEGECKFGKCIHGNCECNSGYIYLNDRKECVFECICENGICNEFMVCECFVGFMKLNKHDMICVRNFTEEEYHVPKSTKVSQSTINPGLITLYVLCIVIALTAAILLKMFLSRAFHRNDYNIGEMEKKKGIVKYSTENDSIYT